MKNIRKRNDDATTTASSSAVNAASSPWSLLLRSTRFRGGGGGSGGPTRPESRHLTPSTSSSSASGVSSGVSGSGGGSSNFRAKFLFGLTYCAYMALYFARKPMSVCKPVLSDELGMSRKALGGVDTALLGAYALGQIFMGEVMSALVREGVGGEARRRGFWGEAWVVDHHRAAFIIAAPVVIAIVVAKFANFSKFFLRHCRQKVSRFLTSRQMLTLAFSVSGFATAMIGSSSSAGGMAAWSGLAGFSAACANPLLVLFVADLFPSSVRASVVGLWQTSAQVRR